MTENRGDLAGPGLGELLRHLQELTDEGSSSLYAQLKFSYRPRYTPVMTTLMHGPATVTQLQERLAITQGAVSQTIKLMLEDGLVVKEKGRDARRSIVSLSAVGWAALKILEPHWECIFDAIKTLEKEIKFPLRSCLRSSIEALERTSFADRIRAAQHETPGVTDDAAKNWFFQKSGDRYREFRPSYPPRLAQSLAALTPGRSKALDVGCGNGQLTTLLASHFEKVLGIDPSKDQLAHAQSAENVTYVHQSAEEIDLPDESVDLIVVAQAAHWFDLNKFYSCAHRIAKNNAVIALVSYGVPYLSDPVNAVFQQGYWQNLHQFWPPERVHVETGYSELYFPFASVDFPECSCRKLMTAEQFISYVTTWSAYEVATRQGCLEQFEAFFQSLRRHWRGAGSKEIVWPISVRAGRVHR